MKTPRELVATELKAARPSTISDLDLPNPILIGGCGSSGTTLLKTVLDSHPNIACGPELSIFDRPVLYRTSLKDLQRMFIDQDFSPLDQELVFPIRTTAGTYFGLHVLNAGREYHDLATTNELFRRASSLSGFLQAYLSNYALSQGKKRWAEKTPNNVFCIREALELLPDAKFIHVIRDGRDVVLSLCQRRGYDPRMAIYRWLISVEAGIRSRGNPRYFEVRYEDLVLDTGPTLEQLMSFLGEEYDPGMLAFHEAGGVNPLGYAPTPIHSDSIGKWRGSPSDSALHQSLGLMLPPMLKRLGYSHVETGHHGRRGDV